MKTRQIITDWRTYAVMALLGVGITALFIVPDESNANWLTALLASKAVAVASFVCLRSLTQKWERQGSTPAILNDKL